MMVNYTSGVQTNKIQYVCNGVNWGRRVDWHKINNSLISRLKAYQLRQDIMDGLTKSLQGSLLFEDQEDEEMAVEEPTTAEHVIS